MLIGDIVSIYNFGKKKQKLKDSVDAARQSLQEARDTIATIDIKKDKKFVALRKLFNIKIQEDTNNESKRNDSWFNRFIRSL